jgi:hypothetical protein
MGLWIWIQKGRNYQKIKIREATGFLTEIFEVFLETGNWKHMCKIGLTSTYLWSSQGWGAATIPRPSGRCGQNHQAHAHPLR